MMVQLKLSYLLYFALLTSKVSAKKKSTKNVDTYVMEEDISQDEDEVYDMHHHEVGGHSESIMRFSFADDDPKGPHAWDNKEIVFSSTAEQYGKNFCANSISWKTPINIDTKKVIVPEDGEVYSDEEEEEEEAEKNSSPKPELSLIFNFSDRQLDELPWKFGHPTDSTHGLEVRAPFLGTFHITDRHEHIGNLRELTEHPAMNNLHYTNYDFGFMNIYYCDPQTAPPTRSMHQIDGKKFPLELHFMFFSQPPKIGLGKYICDLSNPDLFATTVGACVIPVTVVVLAEFAAADNPRLQPLIDAAAIYDGPSFSADDMGEKYKIPVKGPWSPTWLLPSSSTYYYYDSGNLPVPPCWWVARVYIIKEKITISKKQLSVLTNIKTVREPLTDGKMPCTYSVLRQNRDEESPVKYFYLPYTFVGDDNRKLTLVEKQKKNGTRPKITAKKARTAMLRGNNDTDEEQHSRTGKLEESGLKFTCVFSLISFTYFIIK